MIGKILIIAFLSLLTTFSSAQKHHGYFGKTNFIELNTVSYIPLVKNISGLSQGYKKNGSSLVPVSNDWFNTGFRLAIGRAFKRNFAASFEYGISYWSNPLDVDYSGDFLSGYTNIIRHENIDLSTMNFMPKIHLASKSSLLPMGLNHEIGIGITYTKVRERDYLFIADPQSLVPASSSEFIDYDRRYLGVQFLYMLKMRQPLNKSLMLNYGLRYTIDVFSTSNSSKSFNEKLFETTNRNIESNVKTHNFRNILSLDLGVSYVF